MIVVYYRHMNQSLVSNCRTSLRIYESDLRVLIFYPSDPHGPHVLERLLFQVFLCVVVHQLATVEEHHRSIVAREPSDMVVVVITRSLVEGSNSLLQVPVHTLAAWRGGQGSTPCVVARFHVNEPVHIESQLLSVGLHTECLQKIL